MANLRESAFNYVPMETHNIAELERVNANIDLHEKVAMNKDGEEFSYNFILVDEVEYRVPNIVLKQLKAQLEANPELEAFKVTKEGEGLKTSYVVVPLK